MVLDDFRKVVGDHALIDVKLDKGWFTWSNNRRDNDLVKERLDCFLVSTSWLLRNTFMASNVLRHANSDHDAVLLDTLGRQPRTGKKDPRLFFKYEACWFNDDKAKEVIKNAWAQCNRNVMRGIEKVCTSLGNWQFAKHNTVRVVSMPNPRD